MPKPRMMDNMKIDGIDWNRYDEVSKVNNRVIMDVALTFEPFEY